MVQLHRPVAQGGVNITFNNALVNGCRLPGVRRLRLCAGAADALRIQHRHTLPQRENAGQCLKIRLFGYFDLSSSGTIRITSLDHPANDDCDDRIVITDGVPAPYDLNGATLDGPPTSCFVLGPLQSDVWFNYTATCTGAGHRDGCGRGPFPQHRRVRKTAAARAVGRSRSASRTKSGAYTPASMVAAACSRPWRDTVTSSPVLSSSPDLVGSMTVECVSSPANDNCATPTEIYNGSTPYDATGASYSSRCRQLPEFCRGRCVVQL